MCTKVLGIVVFLLISVLFLGGCCTCFLPCGSQWFAIGVLPPGVAIYQKDPAEQQKENSENPPLTQSF